MVGFIRVLTKHARHCFILCSVTSGLIHTPCTVPSTVSDSIRCASAVVWAGGEQQPTGLQEAECIGPGLHHNVSSLSALICAPNTHTREVSVSLFKNEKRKEKEENSSCRRQPNKSEKQPAALAKPSPRWPVCHRRRGSSMCGASRPPAPANSAPSTQPYRPDSTTPAAGISPVRRAAAPQGTYPASAAAGEPERWSPGMTMASRRGNSPGG
jgi:hypothetical protein